MVTLSTLQPRVGFPVTATLADSDNITADSVSWQWYRGNVETTAELARVGMYRRLLTSDNCAIKDATYATRTRPLLTTYGHTLTAVAQYTDGSPNDRRCQRYCRTASNEPGLGGHAQQSAKVP